MSKLHDEKSKKMNTMRKKIDAMPFVDFDENDTCFANALDRLEHGKTLIAVKLVDYYGEKRIAYHFFLRMHGDYICIYNPIDSFGENIVLFPEMFFSANNQTLFEWICDWQKLQWVAFKSDEEDLFAYAIVNHDDNFAYAISNIPTMKNVIAGVRGKDGIFHFIDLEQNIVKT